MPKAKTGRRYAFRGQQAVGYSRPEGAAQARLVAASAEAQAINQVAQIMGSPEATAQYMIQQYIQSLRDMTRTQTARLSYADGNSSMLSSIGN